MLGELELRNDKKDGNAAELPASALLVYREGKTRINIFFSGFLLMPFYATESSDEASEEGDWPLQSGSESEDQWDELSDYGMDVNEEAKEDDSSDQEEDDDDGLEIDDEEDDSDVVENGLSD